MAREINDLNFNVEMLRSQAANIDGIEEKLNTSSKTLRSRLDQLSGEWQSTAADKFFDSIDTSWMDSVQSYCEMLKDLSDALRQAASLYEPIESEYGRLRL